MDYLKKRKITVLHILSSAGMAGGERYVQDLIQYSNKSFKHIVVLPYRGPFAQILKDCRFNYIVVNMAHKFSLFAISLLIKHIRKNKANIIHTHGFRANFYGRLASIFTGAKTISTIHVSLLDYIDTASLTRHFYILLEKALSFKTSKFICISKAIEKDLLSLGINKNKIALIPNGVDLDRFFPRPAQEEKKRELGIKSSGPIIGTIGRMVSEKGQVYLVEALKYLKVERKGLLCLFIGQGPRFPEIKKMATDLDISDMCIFLGSRKDVELIYPILDIFVLPSIREPFGIVLLEAMASVVPVIATASGGPLDFIKSDVNGVLVPARDSKALALKISYLLSNRNKAGTIAIEGRETVEKQFSIKKIVSKIDDLYYSIA